MPPSSVAAGAPVDLAPQPIGSGTRAALWSALDLGVRQGMSFAVSIVLARLLQPADFGLVAVLAFFSGLSIIFVQGGLTEALIQRQAATREEESAAFWWNLGGGALFAVLLVALGPLVADLYDQPSLAALMWVPAAQTVLAAVSAVQVALLTRRLRFDVLVKAGLAASLLSGVLAMAMAMLGAGIWALALQLVTAAAINSALLWIMSDWRPLRHFSLAALRPLLRFGSWLAMSSLLEVVYSQGSALLMGKIYGVRDLGYFVRASTTQQMPANACSGVISRIALPLLAVRADDPAALRASLRRTIRLAMLVNVPLLGGIALLPDLVLEVLFGAKWLPAAPILAILAGSGLLLPLQLLNLQMVLAVGRSSTFFRLEVAKKLVGVTMVFAGSFFGIVGLAWAMFVFSLVALVINTRPAKGLIGYGMLAQLWDLRPVLLAAGAMAVAVLSLRPLVTLPPPAALALLAAVGAAAYLLVGLACGLASPAELRAVRRRLRRR